MHSGLVLDGLGSVLDIVEALHVQLLLEQTLKGLREAILLFDSLSPLIEHLTLSADEDPLAVPSLQNMHQFSGHVLSHRDVFLERLQGTLGSLNILIMLLFLEQDVVIKHILLLLLLVQLVVVDANVALVHELFEHHGSHVEGMSLPVINSPLNHKFLVLLVHHYLAPVSELLEHLVLHGANEVVAKLSVALVALQLVLRHDVVFLLSSVLLH